MTKQDIRQKLIDLSEEKIKDFTKKLTPNEDNILGVRVPLIKQLAKEIAKSDYKQFLECPSVEYHEECMLWGLVIGAVKTDILTMLSNIDRWLPYVNNWAVCDCSVMSMKTLGKPENRGIVWDYLLNILNETQNPYAKRFCIVAMFNYFLDDEYAQKVADIYVKQTDDHYYIRMAIAWGISVLLVKNYAIGLVLLKENKLPVWTHNKAIQKARESFRITLEQKQELNTLKL